MLEEHRDVRDEATDQQQPEVFGPASDTTRHLESSSGQQGEVDARKVQRSPKRGYANGELLQIMKACVHVPKTKLIHHELGPKLAYSRAV